MNGLYPRFLLAIGSLSYKAMFALGGALSFTLSLIFSEGLMKEWGSAGLAGTLAAVTTTLLLVIPRWMEQRRKDRVSRSEITEQTNESIVRRLTGVHMEELNFYKQRVAEKELLAVFERKRAHKIATVYSYAAAHIQVLEEQLAEIGHKPVIEYKGPSYADLNAEADEEIEKVTRKQLNDVEIK